MEGGTKLFESYGKVTEKEVRWRDICVARRKPRRIFVQANTKIDDNGEHIWSDGFECFRLVHLVPTVK